MISICTLTCRENALLPEMGYWLARSIERGPKVAHEWIIVDERLWWNHERSGEELQDNEPKLVVRHEEPKRSLFRGPRVQEQLPDHSNGFNSCIRLAKGDYVVFLNDCQIVNIDWFALACRYRAKRVGWGCKTAQRSTIAQLSFPPCLDKDEEIPPESACGPCWGAPRARFVNVAGFDAVYAGQYKYQDFDVARRMSRTGLKFYSNRVAWAVTITGHRSREQVSPKGAAESPERNARHFAALLEDERRIMPRVPEL